MPSLFLKDSAGCVLPFYITAQFVVCRISVCVLLVLMQLCTQLLLQQAATLLRNRTMAGTCCVGAPVVPDRSAWCSVEFCVLPVLLSCPHLALSVETKRNPIQVALECVLGKDLCHHHSKAHACTTCVACRTSGVHSGVPQAKHAMHRFAALCVARCFTGILPAISLRL